MRNVIISVYFHKKFDFNEFLFPALQGTSKHFITHSAITCSVQTEDMVACVLLLYNPITKCPLHIHAYRCDSESTAQALNQQLQVLINRQDNQKRFADLETRYSSNQRLTYWPFLKVVFHVVLQARTDQSSKCARITSTSAITS